MFQDIHIPAFGAYTETVTHCQRPERGVHAASPFGSPRVNRQFIAARTLKRPGGRAPRLSARMRPLALAFVFRGPFLALCVLFMIINVRIMHSKFPAF